MRPIALLPAALVLVAAACAESGDPSALPAFTTAEPGHWFNSPPLRVEALRGQVLLLDVWTFDCWNCYRSFPWLNGLEARLAGQAFRVIGIHSPESAHERDPARLATRIEEFGLHHPVMMDDDLAYWRALGNRYWPTFYLVDKAGRIRHRHVGETHEGDVRAELIEAQVRELLAE